MTSDRGMVTSQRVPRCHSNHNVAITNQIWDWEGGVTSERSKRSDRAVINRGPRWSWDEYDEVNCEETPVVAWRQLLHPDSNGEEFRNLSSIWSIQLGISTRGGGWSERDNFSMLEGSSSINSDEAVADGLWQMATSGEQRQEAAWMEDDAWEDDGDRQAISLVGRHVHGLAQQF